jgi:hypothetical protein
MQLFNAFPLFYLEIPPSSFLSGGLEMVDMYCFPLRYFVPYFVILCGSLNYILPQRHAKALSKVHKGLLHQPLNGLYRHGMHLNKAWPLFYSQFIPFDSILAVDFINHFFRKL